MSCFFAPTRSSAEVKTLLGEDFAGVLSSDCWSAYGPQSAGAKQKCWAHLERELKALTTSRFPENREFAHRIFPIIHTARQAHRDYHQGQLSLAELQALRPIIEAELADVLEASPKGALGSGFPSLEQPISQTLVRLVYVSVPARRSTQTTMMQKRGLRPVRDSSQSDWLGLVVIGALTSWRAMMFSFLESMRRQGKNSRRCPFRTHRLVGVLTPLGITRISP